MNTRARSMSGRKRHRFGLAAASALAALTVVVSACGGSSSPAHHHLNDSPRTSQPTTHQTSEPGTSGTAANPELPVTVKNVDGTTTTVASNARIVSVDGDISETIWALGLGSHVVATDTSSTFPPAARNMHKIGYQSELSAEPIIALHPTVVIGSTNAGPKSAFSQLRSAGIPVVVLPNYPEYAGALPKITAVAHALGVPTAGAELRGQVQAAITAAKAKASQVTCHPRVVLLYLRGASVQLMAGVGSGYTSIFSAAGGVDAAAQSGVHGFAPITPEALVKAAPDIIVATTTGLASIGGLAALRKVPGVAETPAGKHKEVLTFEDDFLLNNGPRVGDLLRQLESRFHSFCTVHG